MHGRKSKRAGRMEVSILLLGRINMHVFQLAGATSYRVWGPRYPSSLYSFNCLYWTDCRHHSHYWPRRPSLRPGETHCKMGERFLGFRVDHPSCPLQYSNIPLEHLLLSWSWMVQNSRWSPGKCSQTAIVIFCKHIFFVRNIHYEGHASRRETLFTGDFVSYTFIWNWSLI